MRISISIFDFKSTLTLNSQWYVINTISINEWTLKWNWGGFEGDGGEIRDDGFNYYLMVSVEWKGKEFFFF